VLRPGGEYTLKLSEGKQIQVDRGQICDGKSALMHLSESKKNKSSKIPYFIDVQPESEP